MVTIVDYLRWLKQLPMIVRRQVELAKRQREFWSQGVYIGPHVVLDMAPHARLQIGRATAIGDYTLLILAADPHAGDQQTASLSIGEHTSIGEYNNIRAAGGEIIIGRHCLTAQFVTILASNHGMERSQRINTQPLSRTKNVVHIGDDVWIGAHAVILPGVALGTGCVIGAGAVVTTDIPEYAVAAGVPARVLRMR